ncbi:hypothetical protein ABW286_04210 [Erwinia papayae]|uniref:Uncharacterized protein n=1 Tax=Erwinia papayae TaxID=206499 RepID=A0ABV3MXU8_9GAMM
MHEPVEKSKKYKTKAIASSATQKRSNVKQGVGYIDNRPEAVEQKAISKTKNMADGAHRIGPKPIQRQLTIAGSIHTGTTALGTPLTVNRSTHIHSLINSVTDFTFPTTTELFNYMDKLDLLLGPENDPGGIRGDLINNTLVYATFNAAVTAIVAAVPFASRVGLLNQLGNDAVLLQNLLTDCIAPTGAGSAALRLERVLAATPTVARTQGALAPHIAAQIQIDEKILRGEITGGVPASGAVPTAANRNLIGGHSQAITVDTSYVISDTINNVTTPTQYVSFRKLVRSDVNGFAADVDVNAPGNILATINPLLAVATRIVAAPPAINVRAPAATIDNWTASQASQITRTRDEAVLATAQAALVGPAATAAVIAGTGNAAGMAPFIDAVVGLYTHTKIALTAAIAVENRTGTNTATPARTALDAAFLAWQRHGPVLSANKNSTFAPPGWTDDQVIRAGDSAAAIPATLVRYNPPANNPPDGAIVDSKHHCLTNDPGTGRNFVWVVIKNNATYHAGPPPAITGGNVISSYPTGDTAIPAAPAPGTMDADRFSAI